MPRIEFDLLRNAQDSLKNAVHVLAWPDGADSEKLKHVILSVSHCAELLLKERLRRIDPEHIYENQRVSASNRRTVTSERAILLLETVGNIRIEAKDKQALAECRTTRNQIEHNEFAITQKDARVVIGKVLSFIFFFGSVQLGCSLEDEFKSDDTWDMLLNELYEFADEYGSRISACMFSAGVPIDSCNNCGQETVDLSRDICALCGYYRRDDNDTDEIPSRRIAACMPG
jgi:hypothetical protein